MKVPRRNGFDTRHRLFVRIVHPLTILTTLPVVDALVKVERTLYDTRPEQSRFKDSFAKYVDGVCIEKLIVDYFSMRRACSFAGSNWGSPHLRFARNEHVAKLFAVRSKTCG